MHDHYAKPIVGEIWSSMSFVKFQVTDIKVINDQTWIYYKKIIGGSEYSCLEESFIHRFHKLINESY